MLEAPSTPPVQATSGRPSSKGIFTRRQFLTLGAASAVALAGYSGEIARHEIDVVSRTIVLPGLPDAFAGFRVVQLSDIHLEEYTESAFLKAVLSRTNALRPDLVVLTGDFVSNGPFPRHFAVRWSYRCAGILKDDLVCQQRYAVLGNHDALVNASAITDALVSHGIPVLKNSFVPIEREGQRIWLAGLADVLWQVPDLSAALPRQNGGDRQPVILLCHEPDYADVVVNHRVSLILSGHTHGGQVRIPGVPPILLPALGRKYIEGHFLLGDGTQLYVNRGIGTVNVPFRLFCPPEITLLTLVQSGSQALEQQAGKSTLAIRHDHSI